MPTRTTATSGQTDDATATLRRELDEAREREQATAEVLRVISRSPDDLHAALQTIADFAMRLCDADGSLVRLLDGDFQIYGPYAGVAGAIPAGTRARIPESMQASKQVLDAGRSLHIEDYQSYVERGVPAEFAERERAIGIRTRLTVPMMGATARLGSLVLVRVGEVRPFSDREIALAESFASQAVIAVANARLFSELSESLEQQTAVAGVLQAISRSGFDLQTVLDMLVEHAARLGDSPEVMIAMEHGGRWTLVSGVHHDGWGTERVATPLPVARGVPPGTAFRAAVDERRTVAVSGGLEGVAREFPETAELWRVLAERGDEAIGSCVWAPLLRDDAVLGMLIVRRPSSDPYTERQVAALQTFADQAVIALENARLFEELQASNATLREALEQQTATADVLRIISNAPTQLDRVLIAALENAARLVGADYGMISHLINLPDGRKRVWRQQFNPPPEMADLKRMFDAPGELPAGTLQTHAQHDKLPVQVWGTPEEIERRYPRWTLPQSVRRPQAQIAVPLLRGGESIGSVALFRMGATPFTDTQVALIQTFADQAVIAIENARLFDALKHKSEELAVAGRAKDDFLSRMSHELRTPMNAILGFAEVLAMDPESTPEQREWVGQILGGGRHLLGLINEVLDIARIEAGQLSLSLEPVAIAEVLADVLDLTRPLATESGVELSADDAPEISVRADRQRLRQVLLNLAANGVKYNRPGGAVRVEVEQTAEDRVRLTVRDTGPGIPAEKLDRLFVPFDRLGAEQSRVEGTGLGLAIARRLVEAMGGAIGVESVVGQGSAFWVELPHATGLAGVDPAMFALPAAQPDASAATGNLLYIEDNPANLALVSDVLRFRPGLTLLTATDGRAGLELARERRPDLILLDLNLPELTGAEVLAALRDDPATRAIPVVVISADATEAQRRRLLAAGARDYLTKPLQLGRLLDLLDAQLASDGAS